MRLLFDYQTFFNQNYGGISRYFVELINHLQTQELATTHLPGIISNNIYLKDLNNTKPAYFEQLIATKFLKPNIKGSYKFSKIYDKYISVSALKKGDYDIFHPTYYDSYFIKYCKSPFVVTVHDLINEKMPDLSSYGEHVSNKKLLLEKAKRIIAISANTRDDITDIYKINPDKIDVVYHGVNTIFKIASDGKPHTDVEGKYILFVGSRSKYKNFDFMIKAIASSLIANDIKLICTGSPFTADEYRVFNELNISNNVIHEYANDGKLVSLYQNALFFLFPSLYEGFGMPILEAFASGCPCLLSNNKCFIEIAGDAAAYFELADAASLKTSVDGLINDAFARKQLAAKGQIKVKEFSWENTAKLTYQTYLKSLS